MSKKKTTTTTTTVTTVTHEGHAKEIYDVFILDRSGSMRRIWTPTIDGLNEYISTAQRKAKESGINYYVSLYKFDDQLITVYEFAPAQEVKTQTYHDDPPRGGTALNDSLAHAVRKLKDRLKNRENSDDVDVTITAFTDGEENSSELFKNEKIPGTYRTRTNSELTAMLKDVQDRFKWTVAYIGAGLKQDVEHIAKGYGIVASNVRHYDTNPQETAYMFKAASQARSIKTDNYTRGVKCNMNYFAPPADQPEETHDFSINPLDPNAPNDTI